MYYSRELNHDFSDVANKKKGGGTQYSGVEYKVRLFVSRRYQNRL